VNNEKKTKRTPLQEAFLYNVLAIDCIGRGNPSLAADMCRMALRALETVPGVS
jgi:hypothetical protein